MVVAMAVAVVEAEASSSLSALASSPPNSYSASSHPCVFPAAFRPSNRVLPLGPFCLQEAIRFMKNRSRRGTLVIKIPRKKQTEGRDQQAFFPDFVQLSRERGTRAGEAPQAKMSQTSINLPDVIDGRPSAHRVSGSLGDHGSTTNPLSNLIGAAPEPGSDNDVAFVCNICLEGVKDKDPVVTQCGHLYCWPCLYRWLNTRHGDGTCPICKAGVTQNNVIPIFIRGSSSDPRSRTPAGMTATGEIPSRPQGHRPEPVGPHQNPGFLHGANAQFGGMTFSAGMGFFPSLFGLQFQSFTPQSAADQEDEAHRDYLSRVLLILGISVILCLLFF